MRIVISYSKAHFSPHGDNIFQDSSAGFIAKNVFDAACEKVGESRVHYFDHSESKKSTSIPRDELIYFIGINADFLSWVKKLRPAANVLISVNASPNFRRESLLKVLQSYGVGRKYISGGDSFGEKMVPPEIVDRHLILGDLANIRTFVRDGVDFSTIFPIQFQRTACENLHNLSSRTVLMPLGEVCVRKGFLEVERIMEAASRSNLKLLILGRIENKHIEKKMIKLKRTWGESLTIIDKHIIKCSNQWHEIFGSALFSVFPSTEEGIPDMIFDSIKHGVPVFHSAQSGIPRHQDFPLLDFDSKNWDALMDFAKNSDLTNLANKQSSFFLSPQADTINSRDLIGFATSAQGPIFSSELDQESAIETMAKFKRTAWPSLSGLESDLHEDGILGNSFIDSSGLIFRQYV